MSASLFAKDILSIQELAIDEILAVLALAEKLQQRPQPQLLADKILAHCFFEASTRTRLSFESAMLRAGGKNLGFTAAANTSFDKGESLSDAIKMLDSYADAIVIRHPLEGAARVAAEAATVPVINAGDGANQHPTQTLVDLFAIKQSQGTLDNLNLALVGDLKYGRTAHSLVQVCAMFNMRLYFIATQDLFIPDHLCDLLRKQGVKFSFHQQLAEVIDKIDIIYMTRLQKERLLQVEQRWGKDGPCLRAEDLVKAKATMRILHPLPRNQEIDISVDKTPHAYYFTQAKLAVVVRQALLAMLLKEGVTNE